MNFSFLITTAHASNHTATCVAQSFLDDINKAIFYPLIIFLAALALLYFLWGAFKFIWNANNPSSRADGSKHMMYGIIGLLVMVSAAAILAIAANTFGLDSDGKNCTPESRAAGGTGNSLFDFGTK